MAKLSLINRDQKRRKLVKKFAKKREELEAMLNNPKASEEVRFAARLKIQQLPRNANVTRLRNRCALTGPRAAISASSDSRATSSANSRCAARSPASSRQAGEQFDAGEVKNEHD